MEHKKIYVVVHARMPSNKAYGIHIAKMCEAFAVAGYALTLVVPSRSTTQSLRQFYGLRADIDVVRLPSIVFGEYGRFGFAWMGVTFMLSCLGFLWAKRLRGENFLIYTVDMDTFSNTLLPLVGTVVAEFHSPKVATFLQRFFFRHVRGVVATNILIAKELHTTFGVTPLVEPNGVDEAFFNLPPGQGVGPLYVGRFYAWKGLEVLSSTGLPIQVLGGTREEFEHIFGPAGKLQFAEARPNEVPQWLARANVLLLLGTAKNETSNRYTAPMKVFEYLATGKPVVASATEALQNLVPADLVEYCSPDDPYALKQAIEQALHHDSGAERRQAFARAHTWSKRAERIAQAFF